MKNPARFALLPALLFLAGFSFAHAETWRQPVDSDQLTLNNGDLGPTVTFVAPETADIYSMGVELQAAVPNVYSYFYAEGVSGTPGETHPLNYPVLVSQNKQVIAFDFSNAPFHVIQGQSYFFRPLIGTTPYNPSANPMSFVFGSNASTSIYIGADATTTGFYCTADCGSMKAPYFFLSTTPLNLNIPALYPSATTTALDLSTAQSFCGSSTYATSTGFWDSTGQAFSRGICLAFAAVFVPSSDSVGQFSALQPELQSKIPFSYFYQAYGVLSGLQATTTDNLPTLSVNLSTVDIGSSTPLGNLYSPQITILSTSTISRFFPDDIRTLWLNFLSVALWFILIMHFYHKISSGAFLNKHDS